jgi:hypothetical protein
MRVSIERNPSSVPPGNKSSANDVMVTGSVVGICDGMEDVCDEGLEIGACVSEI